MNSLFPEFNPRLDNGQPKLFVTYYGDIYHGRVIDHTRFSDRFYILSNNQMIEFDKLREHTAENYRRLAHEIRDPRIIKFTTPNQQLGVDDRKIDTTRSGDQVWKKMFVFGAGASANYVFGEGKIGFEKSPHRPPLGNQIFDDRFHDVIHNFPGARYSIPAFEAGGKDIEGLLEEEWRLLRNSYNPEITARHINLQFYLQTLFYMLSERVTHTYYRYSLFSLFATKLQKHLAFRRDERVALVSFNYDTIFDQYIEKIFSLPFDSMRDYIDYNKRQVLLFKPHGSCNWGWPVRNRQQLPNPHTALHQALFEERTELWEIYYRLLGDMNSMVHAHSWGLDTPFGKNPLRRYTINKNKIEVMYKETKNCGDYFPALLMPYRDKDEFVMHYDHQGTLQSYVNSMEELYLIGWKGSEQGFVEMIRDQAHRLRKIVIVNPKEKETKEVSANLSKYLDMKRYEKVEVIDTFEEFVLKEMDKMFPLDND
jgi:hypothetical protein